MNIDEYLKIQNDEFVNFIKDPKKIILVATESPESLLSFYEDYNGQVERYKDDNSYVVKRSDGHYELFILGSYPYYRKRFRAFLTEYYQIPKDFKLVKALNVDHVFNKDRAKDYFIRMILLDGKVNSEWGRAYEKVSSNLDRKFNVKLKQHMLLDYSVLLKILKFDSFKKGDVADINDIERIAELTFKKLFSFAGPDALTDNVKTFYRAEINRLANEVWNDPSHIETEEIGLEVDNVMDLARFLENLVRGNPIDLNDVDFEGKYIAPTPEVQTLCFEIINNLIDVTEIDWKIYVRNRVISSMVIRLYYADKDAIRFDVELRRIDASDQKI